MTAVVVIVLAGAFVALLVAGYFFTRFPRDIAAFLNRVSVSARHSSGVSEEARALHARLLVADLHCDALLWERDFLERGSYGHVDLPRLLEGNVALQVLSAATKMPLLPRLTRNTDRTDSMTPLVIAQRWPRETRRSLSARALFQAARLRDAAARSNGRLLVIESAADLTALRSRREGGEIVVGSVLLLEGLHALEGRLERIDAFFETGFRILGLVHLFDNAIGGSMHGVRKGGLTPFGRRVIERMNELGMVVDLAHASGRLIEDALALANRPVVVSHTGVKGHCNTERNITDESARAVAAAGGVIGIGFWRAAVCGRGTGAIAGAIRYTADLVGIEHVALGSDFDGGVRTPFDAGGISLLTQALLEEGLGESEIAKIMGCNVFDLLARSLPGRR
jgi:membrane dipeptidase